MAEEKKIKIYCGRCEYLDLSRHQMRYMETYYFCSKYERHFRAHDVCYEPPKIEIIEVPLTVTKEQVEQIIPGRSSLRNGRRIRRSGEPLSGRRENR